MATAKKNTKNSSTNKYAARREPFQRQASTENAGARIASGMLFLLLGAVTAVSYFVQEGSLVVGFRKFLSGIFGYGFWALAVCFIWIAIIIFQGRVRSGIRIVCIMMIPVLFSSFIDLLSFDLSTATTDTELLFTRAQNFKCGGVLPSLLVYLLVSLLSGIGTGVVLLILMVICVAMAVSEPQAWYGASDGKGGRPGSSRNRRESNAGKNGENSAFRNVKATASGVGATLGAIWNGDGTPPGKAPSFVSSLIRMNDDNGGDPLYDLRDDPREYPGYEEKKDQTAGTRRIANANMGQRRGSSYGTEMNGSDDRADAPEQGSRSLFEGTGSAEKLPSLAPIRTGRRNRAPEKTSASDASGARAERRTGSGMSRGTTGNTGSAPVQSIDGMNSTASANGSRSTGRHSVSNPAQSPNQDANYDRNRDASQNRSRDASQSRTQDPNQDYSNMNTASPSSCGRVTARSQHQEPDMQPERQAPLPGNGNGGTRGVSPVQQNEQIRMRGNRTYAGPSPVRGDPYGSAQRNMPERRRPDADGLSESEKLSAPEDLSRPTGRSVPDNRSEPAERSVPDNRSGPERMSEPLRNNQGAPARMTASSRNDIKDPEKITRKDTNKVARSIASQISKNASDVPASYDFPPTGLLNIPRPAGQDSDREIYENRVRLENALHSFGVNSSVVRTTHGPTVTRYDIELEQGVKLTKVTNLSNDLALSLGVSSVRIAPIPDEISTVGIEVPNKIVNTVSLREILESDEFINAKSRLSFAIGKDIGGKAIVGNISKLPHMLIAGTTGSGKSVCMNSLIISLLYKSRPDEVKLIMIDPKMVELGIYNSIPHLYVPVVTEPKKAAGALQWSVVEMLKRYRLFSEVGMRDLQGYNQYCRNNGEQPLPQVVIVIDELADLMMAASKEVEESICRIAQMGRAAGMHLIIATQRPSADVITGLMKANIPSRIAFAVSSALESRIILDQGGADKLIGMGDMLYAPIGCGKPHRVQGAFVSDEEREKIIKFISAHSTFAAGSNEELKQFMDKAMEGKDGKDGGSGGSGSSDKKEGGQIAEGYDEMLPEAVEVVLEMKSCSVSMLQRRIKLGYSRAARIVDQMEELGVVGPYEGAKPRTVPITREDWNFIKAEKLGLGSADSDYELAAELSGME